jgi:hypothetical protein
MQMALLLTGSILDKATFFLIALEEAIRRSTSHQLQRSHVEMLHPRTLIRLVSITILAIAQ